MAKSDDKNAAENAELILNRLEEKFLHSTEESIKLNSYAYNLVIDAWSRSCEKGAALRADAILERMHNLYVSTQNEAIRPDKVTYTTVIKAWINGREEGFSERSATLLSEMEQRYFNGDIVVKPDTEREKVITDLFHSCCKDGQVNVQVITTLKLVSSSDLFKELLGMYIHYDQKIRISALPHDWSQNVKRKRTTRGARRKELLFTQMIKINHSFEFELHNSFLIMEVTS